jgi:hypothetical protein
MKIKTALKCLLLLMVIKRGMGKRGRSKRNDVGKAPAYPFTPSPFTLLPFPSSIV